MDRIAELRNRLCDLDDKLQVAFESGVGVREIEAEIDRVEGEYFDLIDEEVETIMAMENGHGYW